ncbi:MAG: protein kinase [Alphaproteobacteria bacterium]|nr:protein kinase [Alphaproteobacteria bacterium]
MSPPLQPGDLVDRYRVELPLGQGGMARVYRVRHQTLGTVHALKVLQADSEGVRDRLVAEGRAQARMRHENVVAVTDVITVGEDPALLMEFVGGGSLAELLAARGGLLPLDEALALFRGVLAGVAHAHGHGLVHRDLKPANVLLAPGPDASPPVPKVTDFGLAKALDQTALGDHRTRDGQSMGTPAYMAPEQVRNAATVDRRADVFSLGVMLYELCCGCRPFVAADVVSLMFAVVRGAYTDPAELRPDLPEPVLAAIRGCLVVDPRARLPDCAAVAAVLSGAVLSGAVPSGAAVGPSQSAEGALSARVPRAGAAGAPDPSSQTWLPEDLPAGQDASTTFAGDPEPPDDAPPPPTAAPPPEPPPPTAAPPGPSPAPAARLDPAPTAVPTRAPTTGAARSRTVLALVVDETGQGHVVELVVSLVEGGRGVWAPDGVERDAAVAGQLAVAVALGADAEHVATRWALRSSGVALHGTSIGLAVAVAARAAHRDLPLPDGVAWTGGIDLDGSVASVGGLPAKVRAARAAGIQQVYAPEADAARISAPVEGVDLTAVAHFDQVLPPLGEGPTGAAPVAPARRFPWRLLTLGLPALLVLTTPLAPLDGRLHHHLLTLAHGELALDQVGVVGFDVPDPKSLRAQYPAAIDALVAAGVEAVVFDVSMTAPDPADDAIAAAAARAEAAGVPVVLAVRYNGDQPQLPASASLATGLRLGHVELATHRYAVGPWVRRRATVDGLPVEHWALGAVAAQAVLDPDDRPRLDGGELATGPLRNPVSDEILLLPPFEVDHTVVRLGDALDYARLRDRVAFIGTFGGTADRIDVVDGERWGVELHAATTQALLSRRVPRRPGAVPDLLAALVAGDLALVVGRRLPRRQRLFAMLLPVAVIGVILALSWGGVLLSLAVPLVAAAAALVALLRDPSGTQ